MPNTTLKCGDIVPLYQVPYGHFFDREHDDGLVVGPYKHERGDGMYPWVRNYSTHAEAAPLEKGYIGEEVVYLGEDVGDLGD